MQNLYGQRIIKVFNEQSRQCSGILDSDLGFIGTARSVNLNRIKKIRIQNSLNKLARKQILKFQWVIYLAHGLLCLMSAKKKSA